MKKLIEVMQEAGRNGVAIGHFNIADLVLLKGVFEAARELKVPVIVGASEGEREFAGTRQLAAVVRSLREEFDFPIFLNADHTHSLASALAAVKAGFDSVVFEAGCRMRRNATDGNNFCKIRRLRSKPCRKYAQSAAMKSATTLNRALLDGESFRNIARRTATLRSVGRVTQEILREARGTKNHIIALQAIGRIERQLEFEARFLVELDDSARVAAGLQVAQGPDLSHLTNEELAEKARILREAKEKLDALHARKPAGLIEAAPGSVVSGTEIEVDAQREGDQASE